MPSLMFNLARTDPAYAAKWVADFPEGSMRDNAVSQLVGQWSREDPAATATWLNGLAAGQGRDRAVEQFVNNLGEFEPATAWNWAGSVGDERQRNQALENAARRWLSTDPKAARAAIETSGLSAEAKARLTAEPAP